jgi:hypothetical protein
MRVWVRYHVPECADGHAREGAARAGGGGGQAGRGAMERASPKKAQMTAAAAGS